MRNGKLVWLLVAVAALAGGCKQTVKVSYSLGGRSMVPALKHGDVLYWDPSISLQWAVGQSPCEESSGSKCTVKDKLKGHSYTYSCQPFFCDPEILIDERPIRETTFAPRSGSSDDKTVKIACDDTSKKSLQYDPQSDFNILKGATISWTPINDYSDSDWKLEFDNQANLCESATPINQDNPHCKVKAEAMPVKYWITVDSCGKTAAPITITPK